MTYLVRWPAALLALLAPLAADAALPSYQPQPVQAPPQARYLLPDGSIRIVGTEYVQGIVEALDALFIQTHPGLKFTLQLRGTGTAIPALTHGVTLFAPMGREAGDLELVPYRKIVGQAPLQLRVAHSSNSSPTLPTSLALYVNQANPVERLSMRQVIRIFGSGHPDGDLTRWNQLGLGGAWVGRTIHPYGTPATGGFASHMKQHQLGPLPFSPAYEANPNTKAILKRVSEDVGGIGFAAIGHGSPQLKVVAVAAREGGPDSYGSAADVVAGNYPFGRYLYFSVRRSPGQRPDPLVKEYMRLVLSAQGQAIISAGADGFLPLNEQELAEELSRLDDDSAARPIHPSTH
jgi:phosphate transport system substrate-binding protein